MIVFFENYPQKAKVFVFIDLIFAPKVYIGLNNSIWSFFIKHALNNTSLWQAFLTCYLFIQLVWVLLFFHWHSWLNSFSHGHARLSP